MRWTLKWLLVPVWMLLTLAEATAVVCLAFYLTGQWPSNSLYLTCLAAASLAFVLHHKRDELFT